VASAAESDEAEHGCGDAGAGAEARGGRRGVTVEHPKVARLVACQSCDAHMCRRRMYPVHFVDESSQMPDVLRCAVRYRREHGSESGRLRCSTGTCARSQERGGQSLALETSVRLREP
jgi:hypothetical protein